VSAATYLEVEDKICNDAKIAFGSVDVTPVRVYELEDMIDHNELDEEKINEICAAASNYVKPITDIRGTAEYRRDMCEVLMKRAIYETLERIGE
jgi:carbon-monoxide dehydrogenase medium subunit